MKLVELTKYENNGVFKNATYWEGSKFYVSAKAIHVVEALSDVGYGTGKDLPGSRVKIWVSVEHQPITYDVMETPERIAEMVANAWRDTPDNSKAYAETRKEMEELSASGTANQSGVDS